MNTLRSATLIGGLWLCLGTVSVFFINDYQSLVLGTVAITAIVGVGLNILMGLAGQTSLGHAAFYAIGAYTGTLLITKLGVPYAVAMAGSATVAGLAGALLALPALRAKGPYLAMITIAFGYFVEQGIAEWKDLTGGWNGIMNISRPMLAGTEISGLQLTWFALLLSAALIPAYAWFARSRWGIIMRATRDAEIAASALGAKLLIIRVIAFSLSAALAGIAGSLFASMNGFISPESFPFFQSLIFLLMLMIGGVGYAAGPLLGALVVILLPESLSMLAEYRLIFFGGLLLVVLLIAPNGMAGAAINVWQTIADRLTKSRAPLARDAAKPAAFPAMSNQQDYRHSAVAELTLKDLGITFGGNHALKEVTLSAKGGQVTSLIGPNGAGKTTLINLVTGFYQATQGTINMNSRPLNGLSMAQIGRSGLSRTYQTSQLFGSLSVLDNVYFGLLQGRLWGALPATARANLCEQLLRFVGYQGSSAAPAEALAHVDRRLVEIARALAARPAFVLLDEPAAGLSAEEKIQLAAVLKNIANAGIGVLVIEHDMTFVKQIARDGMVTVLHQGSVLCEGKFDAVQSNPKVREVYLGRGKSGGK
jgi:ABC-type branched-subunit amino acid transport system ATPase component/ABC-type branched-subunit amino acid transport system permease subunit